VIATNGKPGAFATLDAAKTGGPYFMYDVKCPKTAGRRKSRLTQHE